MAKQIQASTLLQERLYWREQFLNFSGDTTFVTDYKRPFSWQGKYDTIEETVSIDMANRITQLTQNNPLSLLIFFTTAWSLLSYFYTTEKDIILATPVYKAITELDDSVICLRYKIDPKISFKNMLLQNKTTLLNGLKYQALKYEDFLTEVGLKRKKNRSSPFSAILSLFQHQPVPNKNRYRSDLFITIDNSIDLKLKIEYNANLFRRQTIEYMILHFNKIVSTIIKNTDLTIQDIQFLSEEEKKYFDLKLKEIEEEREHLPCIHQRFETIVLQYPEKIAVECKNETITYKDLNEKANQIANQLIQIEGVREGQFIGFIGERSIEYCIAILGILKAGCAFVPIDSSYPLKRVENIINDSQIKIIIASSDVKERFSSESFEGSIKWIVINENYQNLQWQNLNSKVTASHPAYMIYTSGSTGHPKGAIVRHDGKMNHLLSSYDFFKMNQMTNCLFSASISSDISIWQALAAILSGGKTIIIDNDTLFNTSNFWKYVEDKKVHIMQFVPTFIQTLLELLDSKQTPKLTSLQYLILSGENIPLKLINMWLERFENIPIINAYGPTEASDIVCQDLYDLPVNHFSSHTSIGLPLPYVGVFILNEKKNIQPFNVPGEIYIGGVAVGDGYWQDEKKTTNTFISNPFNTNSKYKWYRTGDFGRLLPNGKIEYMGRLDSQVKIRGFRVELNEIETYLLNTGFIKQCKLLVKMLDEENSLCAYITLTPINDKKIDEIPHQLREYLSIHLPDYMIPNYFIILDSFPLLPGGKIDVLNLPNPREQRIARMIIKPQNEWDQKLITILASVLGISEESFGMQSNFFELGGSSIHLMAAKFQIQEQLSVDVPIENLFRMNTIQELADFSRERATLAVL